MKSLGGSGRFRFALSGGVGTRRALPGGAGLPVAHTNNSAPSAFHFVNQKRAAGDYTGICVGNDQFPLENPVLDLQNLKPFAASESFLCPW